MPLELEDHRQSEIQSLVGHRRRRLRHRIGFPNHGQRGFVERRVARSLDDAGRKHMAHPVGQTTDNVTAFKRPSPQRPKTAGGSEAKPRLPVALIFACLVVVYTGFRYFLR